MIFSLARLPWLKTLPLAAVIGSLPAGWAVVQRDGVEAIQHTSGAWEWLPVPGFGDYTRRLYDIAAAVERIDADAALVMIWAWRSWPNTDETPESADLAARLAARWGRS